MPVFFRLGKGMVSDEDKVPGQNVAATVLLRTDADKV